MSEQRARVVFVQYLPDDVVLLAPEFGGFPFGRVHHEVEACGLVGFHALVEKFGTSFHGRFLGYSAELGWLYLEQILHRPARLRFNYAEYVRVIRCPFLQHGVHVVDFDALISPY